MRYFNGVIVVEGKGDVSFLSSFIECEYVILNGYDMPSKTIDYLKNIRNRKILVLTDPDEAGILIESRIKTTGINYEYIKVDPSKCNKRGKHGVAECEKEEILRVLDRYLQSENSNKVSISLSEFNELGLMDSSENREKLSNLLHLGDCNSKTMYKRMNYNGITAKMVKELWK